MKIGLVGLPNVGKSTLFKALTKKQVDIANYPFCTIEPNVGIVPVTDERLDRVAATINQDNIIPATVEFVDIAGLVEGASKGEGLGNKFLSHIREVDAIANVLRYFQDGDVTHVAGQVDPNKDLAVIMLELILADLQTAERAVERMEKAAKSGSKEDKFNLVVTEKLKKGLEEEKLANTMDWSEEEKAVINGLSLLTMKPMINILNVGEADAANFALPEELNLGMQTIVLSAKIESELAELERGEALEYLETIGLKNSGLDRLVEKSYELLGLISYFTCGDIEAKAWTINKGATAPEAAGKIHTDFIKKFVKAEVVSWQQFIDNGGWEGCREKGVLRIEGKDYVVQDGDVMYFKIGQ